MEREPINSWKSEISGLVKLSGKGWRMPSWILMVLELCWYNNNDISICSGFGSIFIYNYIQLCYCHYCYSLCIYLISSYNSYIIIYCIYIHIHIYIYTYELQGQCLCLHQYHFVWRFWAPETTSWRWWPQLATRWPSINYKHPRQSHVFV